MVGTIGNYSANYYKTYSFNSSDKYTKNAVDASKISKERFNVSNLTNALDSLGNKLSDDFPVVTNVDLYSKNMYKMSQIAMYEDLKQKFENNNITDFLGMYKIMGRSNEISVGYVKSLVEEKDDDSNIISKYSDYLSQDQTGSIFDILV